MAAKNTNRARNQKRAKRRRVRRAQLRAIRQQTTIPTSKSEPLAANEDTGKIKR